MDYTDFQTDGDGYLTIAPSGGIISLSGQSAVSVYLGSNQDITASTITKLVLDTEVYDVRSEFDSATNYEFTATEAGKYLICAQAQFISLDTNDDLRLMVYVNGSSAIEERTEANNAVQQALQCMNVLDLSVADVVDLRVLNNTGGDRLSAGQRFTFLSITKLH